MRKKSTEEVVNQQRENKFAPYYAERKQSSSSNYSEELKKPEGKDLFQKRETHDSEGIQGEIELDSDRHFHFDHRREESEKFNQKSPSSSEKPSDNYSQEKPSEKSSSSSEKRADKYSSETPNAKSDRSSKKQSDKHSEEQFSFSEKSHSSRNNQYESSHSYSEDHEQDPEPKREITKTYTITLPVGVSSNKVIATQKIGYTNKTDKEAEFYLWSSDPGLVVKENIVIIAPGEKAKLKIKLEAVVSSQTKSFCINIDLHGEPWETIELVAIFEQNS